tara:strand:+ start:9969 stop:10544 length:576 start_codon:yes stop_codon:yes gene_type:complete
LTIFVKSSDNHSILAEFLGFVREASSRTDLVKAHPKVTEFTDPPVSEAAVRVIAAFASRESATVQDILALTQALPAVLAGLQPATEKSGTSKFFAQTANETAIPAVAVAESVTDDSVTCLCCGRSFTMLKRHLRAEHGLSEGDYRIKFNLDDDHPLVAPNYSLRKADYAKKAGLGRYARDEAVQENLGSQL